MASEMDVDRSLDDMIQDSKKNRKRNNFTRSQPNSTRGIGRQNTRGFPSRRNFGPPRNFPSSQSRQFGRVRLEVNNLDFAVSTEDLTELFREFRGMERASIHYDETGRSLGSGHVIYRNKESALRALESYQNVLLDRRPMKLSLPPTLSRSGGESNPRQKEMKRLNNSTSTTNGTNGWKSNKKEAITVEKLDQQLKEYISSGGASTGADDVNDNVVTPSSG
ncbi:hypothetical protein SNEBB_010016 [Seison nebaliae]|nr:hypothetical protein SNEBB_010016 [Seison nebaliae]